MPLSIPTYYASQFVKNANLYQRRKALKKSYVAQYMFTSIFTIVNIKSIVK
jgi:hypothetical protein